MSFLTSVIESFKGMLCRGRSIPFVLVLFFFLQGCSGPVQISELFLNDQAGISDATWKQIQLFQDQLIEDDENVKALFSLASGYLQAVRENADATLYTKIDQLMDQVRKLDPEILDREYFLAQVELGRHQFVDALKRAEMLVEKAPELARYYGVLADAQIELGRYDEALESLQTMIDLKPDFSSYSRIAYIREIFGDPEGAIEMMELATEAAGSIPENQAWSFSELGRLWMGTNKDFSQAAYENALRAYPDFPVALEGLAKLAAFDGDLDKALELIQKAFDQLSLPQYAASLADIYVLQGNQEKADVYYRLVELGYDQIAKSGTNVTLERAEFLVRHGKNPEIALDIAQQAYEERPTIFSADTLAWAYYLNQQYEKAQEYMLKALETDTQDPRFLYHAGMIAKQLGRADEAKRLLNQSLSIHPRFSLLEVRELQAALAGF